MAIETDWSIDYTAKTLSYVGAGTRYTVNALYSWLMDLFDDAGQMDDAVPMKANTPTEYEMINGWTFAADAHLGYLYGGSIKVNATDDLWANFYSIGTLKAGTVIYIEQGGALVATHPGYASDHIDQLVKVRAAGADVAARTVTLFARNLGDKYDHFELQAPTTGGRNPVPLATETDTNDDASGASVVGVTITFGATTADVDADGTAEPYGVTIDGGGNSSLAVYRYLKYVARRQNTAAVGTGNATQGRFYRAVDGSYTEVKASPFGTFAGGKFFGARGVLLTNISDPNNRQLIDSNNVTRTPPVSITVNVTGVQAGDRVLVARAAAGTINKSQFTLAGAHAGVATITVSEAVGNDIPSAGVIRVGDTRYTYTGLNRGAKQFTGVSPTVTAAAGAGAYVPLIDDLAAGTTVASPAMIYVADFDVIARVRKKGIQPFENTGTVTAAGLSISAIRTTDTIVT